MAELHPILFSWFVGFLSGFLASIPVGPINVTIINEGAQRGFRWALLIGAGAVVMEVIYCTIGFAGFATFFDSNLVKAIIELVSFILMVFLGVKFLWLHSIPGTSKRAERVEERLHPHSAFMTGFVRVLGNPGVLLLWITLAGAFASHDWVENNWLSRGVCILGIGMGAALWFVALSYLISLKHKDLSPNALIRLSHFSGVFLLCIALFIGGRIVLMLYKHQEALRLSP